mmetsp:Transcript_45450/g.73758  ORF Transcript_45450/g.73758 Transcript_45450/m.73758 type:complete len:205 (+) Transcript_45450:2056-2670(+)
MPRATTAAWLVMPPRVVSTPWAEWMPWISSGLVSIRTRITFSPFLALSSASSAVKTTVPLAAPGEAGRPFVRIFFSALGSRIGCNSWSSNSGFSRITASDLEIRPSCAMSTAICSAAWAVRLPVRVCSMYSVPRCMVNSMSCISLKCSSSFARMTMSSWNRLGITSSRDGSSLPCDLRPTIDRSWGVRIPATTSSPCALTRNSP